MTTHSSSDIDSTTEAARIADRPAIEAQAKAKGPKHRFGGPKHLKKAALGVSAAALLVVGVIVGGVGTALLGGGEASLMLKPQSISSLGSSSSSVAIAGKVSEVFGNKLIVEDGSGRALVETGPRRWSGTPAEKGEAVTVQGRFEDGFLHARTLVHADGTVEDLGPRKPPFGHLGAGIARLAGR